MERKLTRIGHSNGKREKANEKKICVLKVRKKNFKEQVDMLGICFDLLENEITLIRTIGVFGTFQLHFEPLHADLKSVHCLNRLMS